MFASSFEIWDQRLLWSRELMPVLSLERHMLDARSKTLALLFQIWLLVVPSAEKMIRLLSRVRCILTDMGTKRLMANMVGGLPLRALPMHGCTRTRATASHAHLRSLSAESRLDASMGCDSQAEIQLNVVVPVLVRWHACSGQFLSVVHDGIPTLQALEGRRAAASHS